MCIKSKHRENTIVKGDWQMTNLGIIRRIDDLGRIVIPKELRKKLKINEGDEVQIYTQDNEVILKKHVPLNVNKELINSITKSFEKVVEADFFICNKEKIISVSNKRKNKINDLEISKDLFELLDERKITLIDSNKKSINLLEKNTFMPKEEYIVPIISNTDLIGGIVLFLDEYGHITDMDKNIICQIATLLSEYI